MAEEINPRVLKIRGRLRDLEPWGPNNDRVAIELVAVSEDSIDETDKFTGTWDEDVLVDVTIEVVPVRTSVGEVVETDS